MRFDTVAVRSGRGSGEAAAAPEPCGDINSAAGAPSGVGSGSDIGMVEGRGAPHVPGIDLSTTYGFHSSLGAAMSMDRLLEGSFTAPNPVYARLYNPTVGGFEVALAELEGADGAVAFASGMAAICALLVTVAAREVDLPRPHVVATRPVYGGTDHLLTSGLLGTTVSWVSPDAVYDAIRPDTGLVLLETPSNPTLSMIDIADVVAQAGEAAQRLGHAVPVAKVESTATPVLQNPISLGADFAVHSATKFLGGHGDAMGGVIACSEQWASRLRRVRVITGGVLHPLAGYLLHRGLQTLPTRVRAQQENAAVLAGRLSLHPSVSAVHYPGLSGEADERRLLSVQQRGPGSVLAFRVRGGPMRAQEAVESLDVITRAVSLGSVDTLVQIPAQLTHRVVAADARATSGVPDDLLRLSVGLESVEDLWEDLDRALSVERRTAA